MISIFSLPFVLYFSSLPYINVNIIFRLVNSSQVIF